MLYFCWAALVWTLLTLSLKYLLKDYFVITLNLFFPDLPTCFSIFEMSLREKVIFSLSDEIQMHSLS